MYITMLNELPLTRTCHQKLNCLWQQSRFDFALFGDVFCHIERRMRVEEGIWQDFDPSSLAFSPSQSPIASSLEENLMQVSSSSFVIFNRESWMIKFGKPSFLSPPIQNWSPVPFLTQLWPSSFVLWLPTTSQVMRMIPRWEREGEGGMRGARKAKKCRVIVFCSSRGKQYFSPFGNS